MVIRGATAQDIPQILAFIRGLAEYEKLQHEVEATPEKLQATLFPADGGRSAAECVIALIKEGHPAGFALFFTNYSTFLAKPGLYLEDLFVAPEFRGQGFGRALILHLVRLAHARGYGRMEWSVLDWNAPAIRFYESLGARVMPDWRICRLAGDSLSAAAQMGQGKKIVRQRSV